MLVSYRFNGFLDDIYATLVVRLQHTKPFEQSQLWRYAADFKTLTQKQLGVKLTRLAEGAGELDVYFDPTIPVEEKIIFSQYVHEHLVKNRQGRGATAALRLPALRHACGQSRSGDEKAWADGKKDIPCVNCDRLASCDRSEETDTAYGTSLKSSSPIRK